MLPLWVNEAKSWAGIAFTRSHACVSLHNRIMLQNNDQGLLRRSEIPPGLFCHLEETVALPSPCVSHLALFLSPWMTMEWHREMVKAECV